MTGLRAILLAAAGMAICGPTAAIAGSGAPANGSPASPIGATLDNDAIMALAPEALPPEPSLVYGGPVVVGEPLPEAYTYYPVPQYEHYGYIILNDRPVIVERRTRRVVRVLR